MGGAYVGRGRRDRDAGSVVASCPRVQFQSRLVPYERPVMRRGRQLRLSEGTQQNLVGVDTKPDLGRDKGGCLEEGCSLVVNFEVYLLPRFHNQ